MTDRGLRGFREKEGGLPRRSQGRLRLRDLDSGGGGGSARLSRVPHRIRVMRLRQFTGSPERAQEGCGCAISISGREGPRGPMTDRGLRGFREKGGGLPRRSQGRLWLRCLEF
jgi:hypothetical protein